jgi:hypothetical protein
VIGRTATKKYLVKLLEEGAQPERGVTYGIVQAGPYIPNGVPYIRTGHILVGFRTKELFLSESAGLLEVSDAE